MEVNKENVEAQTQEEDFADIRMDETPERKITEKPSVEEPVGTAEQDEPVDTEVQDPPEVGEEKEKGEEEESQGGEEEEQTAFSDLTLEDEVAEAEPENTGALMSQLGLPEETTIDELKSRLNGSRKESQVEYPEHLQKYIEQQIEVGKVGGSIDKLTELQKQDQQYDGEIQRLNKWMEDHEKFDAANTREERVQFLKNYWRDFDNARPEEIRELAEDLEGRDDAEIIRMFRQSYRTAKGLVQRRIDDVQSKKEQTSSGIESLQSEAREAKRKADARIKEAVSSYEDPHAKRFTEPVKKIASRAFNSQVGRYEIPEGIARELFLNEKGEFDPAVVTKNIGTIRLAERKIEHLLSRQKKEQFREMREPQDTRKKADNRVESGSKKEEDFSNIAPLTARGRRRAVEKRF